MLRAEYILDALWTGEHRQILLATLDESADESLLDVQRYIDETPGDRTRLYHGCLPKLRYYRLID
jgi:hypothetical protein